MKKTYVVDTNVLLEDAHCLNDSVTARKTTSSFYKVIEELDGLKKDPKKREIVLHAVDALLAILNTFASSATRRCTAMMPAFEGSPCRGGRSRTGHERPDIWPPAG